VQRQKGPDLSVEAGAWIVFWTALVDDDVRILVGVLVA
jgi:hypothetical protein